MGRLLISVLMLASAFGQSTTAGTVSFKGTVTMQSVTTGSAPTVSAISPAVGVLGTPVTIMGTNFLAGATVTIGGVSTGAVTVVNSTTITTTAGSHAATNLQNAAVAVTTSGGTGSLPNAFYYPPVATTTYANINFNDGTTGVWTAQTDGTGNCITPVVVTTPLPSDATHVLKAGGNTGNGNTACVQSSLCGTWNAVAGCAPSNIQPPNPALDKWLFLHFEIALDAIYISNSNGAGSNNKLVGTRYNPGPTPPNYSWVTLGIGSVWQCNGGGDDCLSIQVDSGLVTSNATNFNQHLTDSSYVSMNCGFNRVSATHLGTVTCWIGGVLWWTQTDATLGSDSATDNQSVILGAWNVDNIGSPTGTQQFAYLANVKAMDGWAGN